MGNAPASGVACPSFRDDLNRTDACHGTGADQPAFSARRTARENRIPQSCDKETDMKGILLWLIGLPIPIIILLYLFNVL